jgi:hypothetical protein
MNVWRSLLQEIKRYKILIFHIIWITVICIMFEKYQNKKLSFSNLNSNYNVISSNSSNLVIDVTMKMYIDTTNSLILISIEEGIGI